MALTVPRIFGPLTGPIPLSYLDQDFAALAQASAQSVAELRTVAGAASAGVITTLGYFTPGDGGGGTYYYDSTDITTPDNGGTVLVGNDLVSRWKLVHTGAVSVKQFGLGSNVANDIAGYQVMMQASRDQGFAVWFPAGVKCYIEFSPGTPYVFIDGSVKIFGEDAQTCGIRFNCTYDMGAVHAPLFCWGIPSKGAAVNKVYGGVRNIGWFLTAGCLKFERCNHVYGAHDFAVDHCYADFSAVTWATGQQAGGWWSSNVQPTFAVGQTTDVNITLSYNTGKASAEYQNSESFGFTNVSGLNYLNNRLIGWADDVAAHQCTDVLAEGNHIETVSGRYYLENCQRAKIINNGIKPLPRPLVGGYLGPTRNYLEASMQTQSIVITTDAPNIDIDISDNSVYLPAGSYCSPAILTYGVQDGLTIRDNTVYNDGNGGGATSPTSLVLVSTLFRTGWTGPAGNPDVAAGGSIRLRTATISGNKCAGAGWLDGEGACSVVVYAGGAAGDILGPLEVDTNFAGAYNATSEAMTFGPKNYAVATSTDPLKGVSLIALWNVMSMTPQWVGLLPNSANINNTNFPQGTPTFYTTLDSEGLKFIAQRVGRVMGAFSQFTANLTAGNNVVLRILKNGVQIGADMDSTTNTPSTNPARYTWNYSGVAGMTFIEGDKIEALVTIRAAQGATNVVGRLNLVFLYL